MRNALTPARILEFIDKIYCAWYKLPWTNALNQFEVTCLRVQAIDEEASHYEDRKEIAVLPRDPLESLRNLRHQAEEVNKTLREKLENLPRDEWPEGWSISPEGDVLMPWSFPSAEKLIEGLKGPEDER
ncbi:hypothetical protein [Umezawaea sp. Da 62-37]|uniref:hypothetical protein n=1 Tax=Umezawaea sp. Da 62-37 TaxID=3075927 RepID=UPI0028F7211D|nr:hypothetical protein [Umezawaea sp. Da 62-37]WNV83462.1 hypothetical protein RM788_35525 [Umezawaea sp. Da 62-37]